MSKAELVADVAHGLGAKVEDLAERAKRDADRAQGAVTGVRGALVSVESVMQSVNRKVDEGELDQEQATLVMRYLKSCHEAVRNRLMTAEQNVLVMSGVVAGTDKAMKVLVDAWKSASRRAERLRDDPDAGRPDNALKALRERGDGEDGEEG